MHIANRYRKILVFILTAFAVSAAPALAGSGSGAAALLPAKFIMDNNYFSCGVPDGWRMRREKAGDEKRKIYGVELVAPVNDGAAPEAAAESPAPQAPAAIYVSYYLKGNADFLGYEDFILRNSQNALNEPASANNSYEPVKNIKLNGRTASEFSRVKTGPPPPESKSGESARIKEKLYVLPAKRGFYVLRLTASEADFDKHLKVFELVSETFKGKP